MVFSRSSASTLNSYGYSPHPLKSYTSWVFTILTEHALSGKHTTKPVIISITASDGDTLRQMVDIVQELRARLKTVNLPSNGESSQRDLSTLVALEINTSCPNIKGTPPLSYNFSLLRPLLDVLKTAHVLDPELTIGLKLPPYVHAGSFHDVINTVASYTYTSSVTGTPTNPIAFLTCTNTLGSSLFVADDVAGGDALGEDFALPTVLGGLGGEALHALALGNVYSFTHLLAKQSDPALKSVVVIGVGGVVTREAVDRMKKAGAQIVECATLLGKMGVGAFRSLQ